MENRDNILNVPRATIINTDNGFYRNERFSSGLKRLTLKDIFKVLTSQDDQWRMDIRSIEDFENGIKIKFWDHHNETNDFTLDTVYDYQEEADLFLFDTGEIFYVHKGLEGFSDDDEGYKRSEYSEKAKEVSETLDKKLGGKFKSKTATKTVLSSLGASDWFGASSFDEIVDKIAKQRETDKLERRRSLISKVKESIKAGTYSETAYEFNSTTNEYKIVKEEPKKEVAKESAQVTQAFIPAFEWCRKAKYNVHIELGCYKIDEDHPLLPGFEAKEFDRDGVIIKYAVKSGTNELEQNSWTTNPDRPYIITGTVGERWPVKPSNISSYEVNEEDITISPLEISTKDPSDQEFLVATRIPLDKKIKVISKWAYRDDGTIDDSQVLTSNLEDSRISHGEGDYIVAKHIDGKPEYMELPEEQRNTKEAAMLYSPRIINGSVMETTYDHAMTKEEIIGKYQKKL